MWPRPRQRIFPGPARGAFRPPLACRPVAAERAATEEPLSNMEPNRLNQCKRITKAPRFAKRLFPDSTILRSSEMSAEVNEIHEPKPPQAPAYLRASVLSAHHAGIGVALLPRTQAWTNGFKILRFGLRQRLASVASKFAPLAIDASKARLVLDSRPHCPKSMYASF